MHIKTTSLLILSPLRGHRFDLRNQQIQNSKTHHQGPVHYSVWWPARRNRLLPCLPAQQGTVSYEGHVCHGCHHGHLLHCLCAGKCCSTRWYQTFTVNVSIILKVNAVGLTLWNNFFFFVNHIYNRVVMVFPLCVTSCTSEYLLCWE